MPYVEKGLRRMSHGGSIDAGAGNTASIWHYITNDADTVVEGAGYFNDASGYLSKGDVIFASLDQDGTPELKNYIVTSASGAATVVIALQSAA